ncbi:hypothetical protein [Sphingomonas sp. Leaf25]|nr:hypothetical protein [Sphingomonas sp. Leaf25]
MAGIHAASIRICFPDSAGVVLVAAGWIGVRLMLGLGWPLTAPGF